MPREQDYSEFRRGYIIGVLTEIAGTLMEPYEQALEDPENPRNMGFLVGFKAVRGEYPEYEYKYVTSDNQVATETVGPTHA